MAKGAYQATRYRTAYARQRRGIDREQWPRAWPLTADNPHGTTEPTALRIARAAVAETTEQHDAFERGLAEWQDQCNPSIKEDANHG